MSKEALPTTKSGRKPNIYGSNTDLSLGRDSSNSKVHGTMKRQWKAPADNVKDASKYDAMVSDNKRDGGRDRYNQRLEGGQNSTEKDGQVPEGLGLSGNFGNEFQGKQDKFEGDFLKERGLFGTELPD